MRLVFRVHVPEPSGRIISLQAASNPIECCKSDSRAGSFWGKGPHMSVHHGQVACRNPWDALGHLVCDDHKGRHCNKGGVDLCFCLLVVTVALREIKTGTANRS